MQSYLEKKQEKGCTLITAQDCFNILTPEQQEMVRENTTELLFTKGETIIKQGYVASHVMFIEEGLVRLDVTNDQQTTTVKLIADKRFIGIICTFASKSLDFSSVALTDTRISLIDIAVFKRLIVDNSKFALLLIQHMSNLTNEMVHWITRFSRKNIDGSMAVLMLDFMEIFHTTRFDLPLTRKEMAAVVGYSRESVIQALSRLNREGLLKVSDKHIEILDVKKLSELAVKG